MSRRASPAPSRAPWLIGAGALLLAAAFLALGAWQVERRAWKHALIARVEAALVAAPVPAPGPAAWAGIGPADAYRRVTAEGDFLHDRETLVRATTELGSGYWVLTPLRTPGFTVLVNRGFVPPGRREPATRPEPAPSGPVRVTGLLRLTEPGGGFLRDNRPAEGRWYSRDVAAIGAARALPGPVAPRPLAPYFIDADPVPGRALPVGGLTVIRFADNHLIYALTWFGLALLSLGGGWIALRRRGDASGVDRGEAEGEGGGGKA
ncbi:SURF1 family protein [Roseomonas sp. NAR14]|uniref:SURF1-like protein n=1 Tax=Roseomonas acroporae TaxID=2937791 RepID=A0A9X1Y849_9PROT|nr:SURF1 family protein [Roseomonas acroporae]MCK8784870.1 SURF1 family protein [Roseomonas acroporae]